MNITDSLSANQYSPRDVQKDQLSQESFMTMLLTQLQNQDPLKPFDASTMMQQIAQLTGLSASQKLVDSVESLKENSGISQVLGASQIIGKTVQIATDTLHLNENNVGEGAVVVPSGVETVDVAIYDGAGNKVRTLTLESPGEGVLDFSWDGLDDNGNALDTGYYTMSATAHRGNDVIQLATAASYQVNSVAMERSNGGVILNVDGLGGVNMNDVVKIL